MQQGSKEWHEDRRLGIGGSDAAAAMGMSKWKTPHQLWEEKLGVSEPVDETWDMARGKAMEPLLRQHFADKFGLTVTVPAKSIVSEKYSFMRYSPDGLCDGKILPEFKTARYGSGWGEPGTDQVPTEYLLQCQHGLIVLDYGVARPSVSIGFGEPVYYEVPANKELQEMIIDAEAEFWRKVLTREEPAPINNEDVARMYRQVNGASIIATPEIADIMERLVEVRMTIKGMEAVKEEHEVAVKHFMGENEILLSEGLGLPIATWKQQNGAKRINADRLRKLHPDVAAEVTEQGDPLRRFLVK